MLCRLGAYRLIRVIRADRRIMSVAGLTLGPFAAEASSAGGETPTAAAPGRSVGGLAGRRRCMAEERQGNRGGGASAGAFAGACAGAPVHLLVHRVPVHLPVHGAWCRCTCAPLLHLALALSNRLE